MYKPYQTPVINAFADVKIPQPKISKLFIFIVRVLSKAYMWFLFGTAKTILLSDDILFDIFKRTLNGDSRCIIAFRHPDGREPQFLTWFFIFKLKKLAAKKKIKFSRKPHAIFVYGYEVARWGGWVARLFMPNLGAIPIHHTKMDSKGMARIQNTIQNGPFPLVLAPEGQVSYTTDSIPRLEPGVIRIGFQAAAQIQEGIPLEILPLSFHMRYNRSGKTAMEKLLKKIEKFCAFKNKETKKISFEERLKNCRQYILEINEKRYGIKNEEGLSFNERLEKVVYAALETAERILGIKSEGDFFMRLYKVRHDCWDKIFLPNEFNLDETSKVKRGVLDLNAGEAWFVARHQELADFGWYFTHPLPAEETELHKKIEYVQNLWDFANRTMGGALANRVNIRPSKVILKAGEPINLTERLSMYKEDRKGTAAQATLDLEKAFLDCIRDVNNF